MKQNKLYLLKQLLFWFMKNIFGTISNRQASETTWTRRGVILMSIGEREILKMKTFSPTEMIRAA